MRLIPMPHTGYLFLCPRRMRSDHSKPLSDSRGRAVTDSRSRYLRRNHTLPFWARSGFANLVRASADSLPFRNDALGVVISTTSLKDWANRAEGLAEITRIIRPGGTGLVYDFITAGPESNPPHFLRRFGIVSELLRRATGLVQPFSLQDVRDLAEMVRGPSILVEVGVDSDLAIVKIVISKSDDGHEASEPPTRTGN